MSIETYEKIHCAAEVDKAIGKLRQSFPKRAYCCPLYTNTFVERCLSNEQNFF